MGVWYPHIPLAMFAHAYLAAMRATAPEAEEAVKGGLMSSQPTDSLRHFKRQRGLA